MNREPEAVLIKQVGSKSTLLPVSKLFWKGIKLWWDLFFKLCSKVLLWGDFHPSSDCWWWFMKNCGGGGTCIGIGGSLSTGEGYPKELEEVTINFINRIAQIQSI